MATKTLNLKSLLVKINCKKTLIGESDTTSGNAYRITLTYKGKRCYFTFNDNYLNASEKKDFLYCLHLDAMAYECSRGFRDFARQFAYDCDHDAKRIYNACKKQSERLHKLFNAEEILILSTIE